MSPIITKKLIQIITLVGEISDELGATEADNCATALCDCPLTPEEHMRLANEHGERAAKILREQGATHEEAIRRLHNIAIDIVIDRHHGAQR